jgi:hypothetical protein
MMGGMKFTLATSVIILCGVAFADPQVKPSRQVPVSQIRKRVVAALEKEFPKAEILKADQAQDSPLDCDSWGLSIKDGKQELDIAVYGISGSYEVNSIGKSIAVADVPEPTLEALHARYPNAKVESARAVQTGLRGWHRDTPKPYDYELTAAIAEKGPLIVFLEAGFKRNTKGEEERDPNKYLIYGESAVEKSRPDK